LCGFSCCGTSTKTSNNRTVIKALNNRHIIAWLVLLGLNLIKEQFSSADAEANCNSLLEQQQQQQQQAP